MKMDIRQKDAFGRATNEIGTREIRGGEDNPKIVGWFDDVGHAWVGDDETAWCAAFLGAMLVAAGLESTRQLTARSYLGWGAAVSLDEAEPGDLLVFWRESPDSWQGHVGFYVDHNATEQKVWVLGGNQANEVNIAIYPMHRLLGVRRMPAPAKPSLIASIIEFFMKLFKGR